MNKDNTHILARAVIIDNDHILLYKTLDMRENFFFLPGGHVEHGESAKEALKREMIEETGCEVIIKRFLGCIENIFENSESCKCHNHDYSFIFEVESKSLNMRTQLFNFDDRMELSWMSLSELSNIPFKTEALKKLIPKWLNDNLNEAFGSVEL